MNKIKVSWTILSTWQKGEHEKAIKMMSGEDAIATWQMEEGKRIHKIISDNKLKLLPFMKPTGVFEEIDPENDKWVNYFRVNVNEWLDMSMIADFLDPVEHLLIDWKTGVRSSTEQNKLQLYIYAYLLSLKGIEINNAIFGKVIEGGDKTIFCNDYTAFKITQEKLDLALNYIETVAGEIYQAIQQANK